MLSQEPPLGAILRVQEPLGIIHEGVYVGGWRVIAASKLSGRVCEESYQEFSGSRPVNWEYPSKHAPHTVIANARSGLGRPWRLFSDNCQHFARSCHGQKRSPQLERITMAAGFIIAVGLFAQFAKSA